MATIIKEIEVDVSQLNRFAAIVAKQYDKQSRFLKVTLLDSGERIKVESASTAVINARREDEVAKTFEGTCRNNVTDGGGFDTTKDKFFLLSRRELFMGDEVSSVKEGEPYPYYSDYSDYTSPNTGADSNRVKYKNGSPQWQWERTPGAGNSYNVRGVDYAGYLGNGYASGSGGVAPACNVI